MNLNATLLVQMLCFIAFVAVTMKYIWPPLNNILEKRRKEIADGLAAAEQGRKDLELAEHKSREIITEAKSHGAHIIEQANVRANRIIEDAKEKARDEGEYLKKLAEDEIEQKYNAAKQKLLQQVSQIVIAGAEKILQGEVDKASNDRLIREMVSDEI
jgi:F-type H+-transporting ATPase subunit b